VQSNPQSYNRRSVHQRYDNSGAHLLITYNSGALLGISNISVEANGQVFATYLNRGDGDSPFQVFVAQCQFVTGTSIAAHIDVCGIRRTANTVVTWDRNPTITDVYFSMPSGHPSDVKANVSYSFGQDTPRAVYIEDPNGGKEYWSALSSGTSVFSTGANRIVVAEGCVNFNERDVRPLRAFPQSCPVPQPSGSAANSGPNPNSCDCEGDPVRLASGNMRYAETDPIPMEPLKFVRTLDTRIFGPAYSSFGHSWRSMFDSKITVWANGYIAEVVTDTNDSFLFMNRGGTWSQVSPSPGGQAATLTYDGSLNRWSFRASGASAFLIFGGPGSKLIEYRWAGTSRRVTLTYDQNEDPSRVTDSETGRVIVVVIDGSVYPKRITRMYVDGDLAQSWSYGYDASGFLRDVWHTPTGDRWRHYDPNEGALGNVVDVENRILENHNYTSADRARNSIGPSGDLTNIEYNIAGLGTGTGEFATRITSATGAVTVYYQRSVAGQWKKTEIDGNCSCGTDDGIYGFDENTGNVVRVQNAKGYVTEYAYDPLTRSRVSSVYMHLRPAGCDPETSPTQCRLARGSIMAAELEPTSATRLMHYEYADANWRERPTRVSRSSARQLGQEVVETTTYHPTTGATLTHVVAGWTGVTPRAETRTTTTTLYNGTEGAAFDPGGAFNAGWITLPQPAQRQKSADGPRTDVTDAAQWVYYPIDLAVPAFARGKLAGVKNAAGHITRYEDYDVFGNARRVVDANGVATELTYDVMGRLLTSTLKGVSGCDTVVDPLCAAELTTTRSYKSRTGLLEFETRPGGGVTKYEYDTRGRVVAISRGPSSTNLTERMEYEIDLSTGQKRAEKIFAKEAGIWVLKKTLSYTYDIFSRLQKTTHPDGAFAQYTYDAAGNILTAKDENHATANTTYGYEAAERLASVKQKLGAGEIQTTYAYDLDGNLIAVTDPNANVTSYLYDDFGQMIQQTSPVTGVTTYDYDTAGNLTITTDARGATSTRTYDALGRASSSSSTLGAQIENVTWTYDQPSANAFTAGRLTAMSDPSGSTAYAYERRGLLRREQKTIGSSSYETLFRHDADGNRSGMTLPAGDALTYTFDFAGRPTTLTRGAAPVVSSTAYMPFGLMKSLTYGNGLTRTVTFDNRYRLTSNRLSATSDLASYSYSYDSAGNITAITDVLDAGYNRTFGYDDLDRLTTANSGASLWATGSYAYDAMGNLTSLTLGTSRKVSFAYSGTTPKLTSATENGSTRAVSNDAAGNQAAVGSGAFTYTPRNSLASGDAIAYSYDARGVRVSTTRASATRHYLYTPELNLLAETTESMAAPAVAHEYLWFGGAPIAQVDVAANSVAYTFADHLGTPLLQTDAGGLVLWRAEHEPYGSIFSLRAGSTRHQPLRLPGQEAEQFDSQTNGLTERSYNIFRWYRGAWGRYSQSDPIGLRAGYNLFAYASSSPVTSSDSLGLAVNLRCRPVGAGGGLSLGDVAGALGINHCYLEITCPARGVPPTTVSYLGNTVGIEVATGSSSNADVQASLSGNFDQYRVTDQNSGCCEMERCINALARRLDASSWSLGETYNSALGPNSNAVAHRLILECGGRVDRPLGAPGFNTAGDFGF